MSDWRWQLEILVLYVMVQLPECFFLGILIQASPEIYWRCEMIISKEFFVMICFLKTVSWHFSEDKVHFDFHSTRIVLKMLSTLFVSVWDCPWSIGKIFFLCASGTAVVRLLFVRFLCWNNYSYCYSYCNLELDEKALLSRQHPHMIFVYKISILYSCGMLFFNLLQWW